MTFESLNLDITFRTIPTRQSRDINKLLQDYVRPLQKAEADSYQTTDASASEFLSKVAHKMLTEVYGQTLTIEEFEDSTTVSEVCDFLKAQVDKNGPNDFLLKPLGSLIAGLERMLAGVTDVVNEQADKALNQMRS